MVCNLILACLHLPAVGLVCSDTDSSQDVYQRVTDAAQSGNLAVPSPDGGTVTPAVSSAGIATELTSSLTEPVSSGLSLLTHANVLLMLHSL